MTVSTLHSTMFLLKPNQGETHITDSDNFTFHNVSIKTDITNGVYGHRTPLHSTMFLLKRVESSFNACACSTLHSTMFLLKPGYGYQYYTMIQIFTFHNVSIKTNLSSSSLIFFLTLHSTMFLLKPKEASRESAEKAALHSTMFLLKQKDELFCVLRIVSLHSTMFLLKRTRADYIQMIIDLYIPQCFY